MHTVYVFLTSFFIALCLPANVQYVAESYQGVTVYLQIQYIWQLSEENICWQFAVWCWGITQGALQVGL